MTTSIEQTTDRLGLAPSVRLLATEPNVIRLRWGIWNFQEAALDLRREPVQVQTAMRTLFQTLADGGLASPTFADATDLSPVEKGNLTAVLDQLRQAGFLAHGHAVNAGMDMARVLLGNLDVYGAGEELPGRVGFGSDAPSAVRYIQAQAQAIGAGASVDALPAFVMRAIQEHDFTAGLPDLDSTQKLDELVAAISDYRALVVCISRASILSLRNLNRLAMAAAKPIVVGLVDGPFATIVGADAPATGCLECFEQRSLARLEDHVGYHDFVRAGVGASYADDRSSGVESLLCAYLLNEAALLAAMGSSRFVGRALSVYLPTYEIQAQDVLRIASCPACGHVSRDIAEEINFSSRVVIDQHVRHALGAA